MPKNHVDHVFGVSRDLPLNYIDREYVDVEFIESLTRQKHVVVYGGSKQGKTSLRKQCLSGDDYILIQCSNRWKIEDINSQILKSAGFKIQQSQQISTSGKQKINAQFSVSIPGLISLAVGPEKEDTKTATENYEPIDLDPTDVNDIISALNSIEFKKYIILEDFHYPDEEAQKDFAIALKAYHEKSKLTFIVIGVWLEGDRLTTFNGDLTGRVVSVNADRWTKDDLRRVIRKGGDLLNVEFDGEFVETLIANCFDSVYLVQEVCLKTCRDLKIYETSDNKVKAGDKNNVIDDIKAIVDKNTGRYQTFLNSFSMGFQVTNLAMYKWILLPVIVSNVEDLERGIRLTDMSRQIKQYHPRKDELNPGNLTQALQSTAALQVKKNIIPIVIDYDQSNRVLNIVDRQFLIWLSNQHRKEILEIAGFEDTDGII